MCRQGGHVEYSRGVGVLDGHVAVTLLVDGDNRRVQRTVYDVESTVVDLYREAADRRCVRGEVGGNDSECFVTTAGQAPLHRRVICEPKLC